MCKKSETDMQAGQTLTVHRTPTCKLSFGENLSSTWARAVYVNLDHTKVLSHNVSSTVILHSFLDEMLRFSTVAALAAAVAAQQTCTFTRNQELCFTEEGPCNDKVGISLLTSAGRCSTSIRLLNLLTCPLPCSNSVPLAFTAKLKATVKSLSAVDVPRGPS